MVHRPSQTSGLTEDQALVVEQILENVGFIGDTKTYCELYGIQPIRLRGFLNTTRARLAAQKATDQSRTNYYNNLREQTLPEESELPLHNMVEVPKEKWELEQNHLTIRTFGQRRKDGGAQDIDALDNKMADIKSTMKYLRSQDCDMSDEEIKHWNRLANGKKK